VNDSPELEPKLARLLEAERKASDFPEKKRELLYARISGSLTAEVPSRSDLLRRLGKAGALLLVGGALGFVAAQVVRPPPATAPSVAHVVLSLPPRPLVVSSVPHVNATATALPARAPELVVAPRPAEAPTESASDSAITVQTTLAEERSLVSLAREAIARRDGLSAIEALTAHERTFRYGKLAEERDALFVQALALSGRDSDARRRARDFEQRYPRSVFRPRIEAILREMSP
jgi:hypothetical protein